MLNIEVSGSFPQASADMTETMAKVAVVLEDAIRENFNTPWSGPYGQRTLGGPRGRLAQSLRRSSGDNWAMLESNEPFSRILQEGGEIRAKERYPEGSRLKWTMSGYFFYMFHSTGDTKWRAMALHVERWGMLTISPYRYMELTDADLDKIRETMGKFIIETNFKPLFMQ